MSREQEEAICKEFHADGFIHMPPDVRAMAREIIRLRLALDEIGTGGTPYVSGTIEDRDIHRFARKVLGYE